MTGYTEVLHFWFGSDISGAIPQERIRFWFGGEPQTDRLIQERFSKSVAAAAAGRLDIWAERPAGRLALILLLDQFPRNIYRGSPQAYAYDEPALQLALDGIDQGDDAELALVERAFMYMPLEHAENLQVQQRAVELFEGLRDQALPVQAPVVESFADYAHRHRDVIARFGRFPHRNAVLGRTSSPEEAAFLRQPGSRF
ncbi:MAG: DUF924 domain-containing protein [Desulfuromonadales bacterium]|nr:DUF924 domain-containing protein [Desulfuromonadales bacterium]NIS42827.1 DUF924 domain-containing protein [Desulfuromonadales bacterium]